jgi:hypothetical protein
MAFPFWYRSVAGLFVSRLVVGVRMTLRTSVRVMFMPGLRRLRQTPEIVSVSEAEEISSDRGERS